VHFMLSNRAPEAFAPWVNSAIASALGYGRQSRLLELSRLRLYNRYSLVNAPTCEVRPKSSIQRISVSI
jgi:hypothetical protein